MDDKDLCRLSLAKTAELVKARKLSPVELVQAVLRRIEIYEPQVGAFVTLLAEPALKEAQQSEKEIAKGNYRGPLHGIPITIKDLIHVQGVRTTAGSKSRANSVPTTDAAVTERLRGAGAILIGKVQLDELAMGPTTLYHFGVTRNPWDSERLTWGSSSGSAASVAAGFCYASIGTDTSGSIRAPAAACGVVGFKPTYGRVSRYGVVPLSWSQDCVGPLTRTVNDCAIIMNAIAGHDARDNSSLEFPAPDFQERLSAEIKGITIGLPAEFFDDLDSEHANAVQLAVELLERAGATVQTISFSSLDAARTARAVIGLAEAAAAHKHLLAETPSLLGTNVRTRLEVGSMLLATDYLDAQRVRAAFQIKYMETIKNVDVILAPTSPKPVPRFDDPPSFWSADETADRKGSDRFRWPFNLVGAPAISIPCGFTSSGLPIGMQIAARPMADQLVLQVAHAYEQRTEWHLKHPSLAKIPETRP